jgi:hypothetical protein
LFNNRLPRRTIYQLMELIWSPPEYVLVESWDGEFQYVDQPQNGKLVDLTYLCVCVSAFREFPKLSYDAPRLDVRKEILRGTPDPAYQFQFLKRANLVGFANPTIINELRQPVRNDSIRYQEQISDSRYNGESIKQRWGRPFSKAYDRC